MLTFTECLQRGGWITFAGSEFYQLTLANMHSQWWRINDKK